MRNGFQAAIRSSLGSSLGGCVYVGELSCETSSCVREELPNDTFTRCEVEGAKKSKKSVIFHFKWLMLVIYSILQAAAWCRRERKQ